MFCSCEGGEDCMNPLTKKQNKVQDNDFNPEDNAQRKLIDFYNPNLNLNPSTDGTFLSFCQMSATIFVAI